jgi:hypothetical protein
MSKVSQMYNNIVITLEEIAICCVINRKKRKKVHNLSIENLDHKNSNVDRKYLVKGEEVLTSNTGISNSRWHRSLSIIMPPAYKPSPAPLTHLQHTPRPTHPTRFKINLRSLFSRLKIPVFEINDFYQWSSALNVSNFLSYSILQEKRETFWI